MKKLLNIFKTLRGVHWLTLLAVAAVGVFGTFAIGQRLEDKAIDSWTRQAELDAAVATIAAQSWLAQSETIIGGLALGFEQADKITAAQFDQIVLKAEEWNSEFSLEGVAVIKRVLRPQRSQMEQNIGHAFSDAVDPAKPVADAFDHMVVVNSSMTSGLLRPSVDLLTMDKMGIVAKTAQRVPDIPIMGPAFADQAGHLYTLVGIGLPNKDRDTVIVGRVDLSEMIDVLISNHVPDGLVLRLSERDNDARAQTLERPIYGTLKARDDALHSATIRVTRGQAQWNYNWDVTNKYMGGAPTANVTMVQIGGLIITILVVYSIGVMSVQNAIIQRTVDERTKELMQEAAERKQAEKVRRQSEQRLSSHLEHTPLAALAWDENFTCIEWNPAAERIFGFSKEEALGQHAFNFIVPQDLHDQVNDIFLALLNQTGGSHSINENITKDGRKIICEWFNTPLKGEGGVPVGGSSFAQDITESKNAELKLKESEEIFRSFYEIVPDVFMVTNIDTGLCTDVNEGFCRVTGYSRDEVIGKRTTDLGLWEIADDRALLVQGLKENGSVYNLSANYRRKDGTLWPGMMSACLIHLNGQQQVLSSTKDVSDIRRSEMEAVKANKAKSEFLANMSHELRTPLNAIIGFSGAIKEGIYGPLNNDKYHEYLDDINSSGHHLLDIINDILNVSAIEAGSIEFHEETIDLAKVIEGSVQLIKPLAEKEHVSVTFSIDPEVLMIYADKRRVKQILLNLLSNAVKFTQEKGEVCVEARLNADGALFLAVVDTGVGMNKDEVAIAMSMFGQVDSGLNRKYQGTGLGLPLTNGFVELHGGTLQINSVKDHGTTVIITLPKERIVRKI